VSNIFKVLLSHHIDLRCRDRQNRPCQRKNWPHHRKECDQILVLNRLLFASEGKLADFRCRKVRQAERWMHVCAKVSCVLVSYLTNLELYIIDLMHKFAKDWVANQAYRLSYPAGMVENTYFHIELESLFGYHPQSPMAPRSFEFKSMDGQSTLTRPQLGHSHPLRSSTECVN
jgi:hypothetical protein